MPLLSAFDKLLGMFNHPRVGQIHSDVMQTKPQDGQH
jgi:hypothetical protein